MQYDFLRLYQFKNIYKIGAQVMAVENASIEQHKNKVTYLLNVATIVITVVAISWAIFFISIQDWLSLAMESTLVVLGYMGYWNNKRNNIKIIAHVYFPLLFLMICVPFILSDRFRPKSVKY